MAKIIMYNQTEFESKLKELKLNKAVREAIVFAGIKFDSEQYSMIKLGTEMRKDGSPSISLARNADKIKHTITVKGVDTILDGPKVPPKLE